MLSYIYHSMEQIRTLSQPHLIFTQKNYNKLIIHFQDICHIFMPYSYIYIRTLMFFIQKLFWKIQNGYIHYSQIHNLSV